MHDSIAILDFGSQYAQLIARRVRLAQVYCELFPWDAPAETVLALHPKGFILSGGPASVYAPGAPGLMPYVLESGVPVLGLCYGMQLLAQALGGEVAPAHMREYGPAVIESVIPTPFLDSISRVWMSHGDRITRLPHGFSTLARSKNSPIAAMGDFERRIFALQFHPEVNHTPNGAVLLAHFATTICGCRPDWVPASIIDDSIAAIQAKAPDGSLLAAVSGGVDSSVAAALAFRAVGDRLVAVHVDTGLLREGESNQVVHAFRRQLGVELVAVDASTIFFDALRGVIDPEQKRRILGEQFIRVFEGEAKKLGEARYLIQGTIYPDVVESAAPDRNRAARIKSHHNVGGLPEKMDLALIEPLRYLFKDEVRAVGEALGLPEELVWRQPFPGPGLAVRCIGEVTRQRVDILRAADFIFTDELASAGLLGKGGSISQAFAVLLGVHSVGVMGDERTYQETCALRAVVTDDFMTADWARLPEGLLARTANRIVNEVHGINRVVYDITSKPPATIEWE